LKRKKKIGGANERSSAPVVQNKVQKKGKEPR